MAGPFKNRELARAEYEAVREQALALRQSLQEKYPGIKAFQEGFYDIMDFEEYESQLIPSSTPLPKVIENNTEKIYRAAKDAADPMKKGKVPSLEEVIAGTTYYHATPKTEGLLNDRFFSGGSQTVNGMYFAPDSSYSQSWAGKVGTLYKATVTPKKVFNIYDRAQVAEFAKSFTEEELSEMQGFVNDKFYPFHDNPPVATRRNIFDLIMEGHQATIESASSEAVMRRLGYDSFLSPAFNFDGKNHINLGVLSQGERGPKGPVKFTEKMKMGEIPGLSSRFSESVQPRSKAIGWNHAGSFALDEIRQQGLLGESVGQIQRSMQATLQGLDKDSPEYQALEQFASSATALREAGGLRAPSRTRWMQTGKASAHDFIKQFLSFEEMKAQNFFTRRQLSDAPSNVRREIFTAQQGLKGSQKAVIANTTKAVEHSVIRAIRSGVVKKLGVAGLAVGLGLGLPAMASASTGSPSEPGGVGLTSVLLGGAGLFGVGFGIGRFLGRSKTSNIPTSSPIRNRGSSLYNNAFLQGELDATTRGFVAGIGSVVNDFGLNRRISEVDIDNKPTSYVDSFFGKALGGTGYVHPVYGASEATWKVAKTLDEAYGAWKSYIQESHLKSKGLMRFATGIRYNAFKLIDNIGDGWINKQLVRMGGLGSMIAPTMMGIGAISDFKEGYREGGLGRGAINTASGIIGGMVQNKVIASALLNPVAGLALASTGGVLAYTAFKVFDVRNKGVQYLRSGRMGKASWASGNTPGMSSSIGATHRQRAMNSMNNSRFNAMKAIGNESYMMNTPKSRYSNSTAMNNTAPMLSY